VLSDRGRRTEASRHRPLAQRQLYPLSLGIKLPLYDVPYRTTPTLEQFAPVTVREVDRLIGSASCKTCQLDPVTVEEVDRLIGSASCKTCQLDPVTVEEVDRLIGSASCNTC